MSHGKIGRLRQRRVQQDPLNIRQQRLAQGRRLPAHLLARPRRRGSPLLQILIAVFTSLMAVTGGLFGLGVAGAAGAYYYVTHDLPSVDDVKTESFQTTKIYDRNWILLHEIADPKTGWRTKISLEEMSPWVLKGTIATEDATFYENPGIDLRGIARAVYINFSGIGSSGASTITMQLVRNVLPLEGASEFSYTRKIKEAFLALEFNRRFSKDDILAMYLNEVYYGNRSYGIEAASQIYFGKQARDLDLAEASLLVGLPQAPSLYDPTRNFTAAKDRQAVVLEQMVKQGYITQQQADEAAAVDLHARLRTDENRQPKAPHFVNYVLSVLEQRYGAETVSRGGLIVHTTLDYPTQVMAEQVVYDHIQTIKNRNATNGALVAIQPWSGQIIAMVGSADYNDASIDGQVNVAVRERQPGSAFKPISYAAAMMKGWTPSTIIIDSMAKYPSRVGSNACDKVVKTTEDCYIPENFDFKYNGPVTVRESLGRSLNIPAVKAIKHAGVANTINLAHEMGIKTGLWRGLDFYGLAITLGGGEVTPMELSAAYATLANKGVHAPTTPFIDVTDGQGKALVDFNKDNLGAKQVITPEVAYMITDVLKDNQARTRTFGPNSVLNLGIRPAAAKTGSTTDNRDGWTAGYTTELAVAVWVGNSDNSPTQKVDGVVAAGPIWHNFLEKVYSNPDLKRHYQEMKTLAGPDGEPLPVDWVKSDSIVEATVCTLSGQAPMAGVPTRKDLFVRGAVPTRRCGDLTTEQRAEVQSALDTLRLYPNRFFDDGRARLTQLANISRTRATTPTRGPAVSTPPRSAPDLLATPTPADEQETPDIEGAEPTAAPTPRVVERQQETPVADAQAGGNLVMAPNIIGLPEGEAQSQIRAAGLATAPPVYQTQADMPPGVDITSVPVGAVISASPPPGARIERGTVVTIAVRKE